MLILSGIILGIFAFSFLLPVVVSKFEGRRVWPYSSIDELVRARSNSAAAANEHDPNPYAVLQPTVIESIQVPLTQYALDQLTLAGRAGFIPLQSTQDSEKSLVQVRYEFLISGNREILAMVACGKIASIPVQTVYLVSRLRSGHCFTTLAAHAACDHDLDGVRTEMLLSGANFETLLSHHLRRMEILKSGLIPFDLHQEMRQMWEWRKRRCDNYASRKFICYGSPETDAWKFTWWGAFRFVWVAQTRQLRRTFLPDRFLKEPLQKAL